MITRYGRGVAGPGEGVSPSPGEEFFYFLTSLDAFLDHFLMIFFILFTFYSVFIFSRAEITRCGPKGHSARGRGLGKGVSPSPRQEVFLIFEPLDAFLDHFLMIFFILLRFYSVLIFLRAKARRVGVQGKGFPLPLGMIFFHF